MEDDLVCEYDSTWDTESDGDDLVENISRRSSQDRTQKSWGFWLNPSSRNLRAAKDMQNYRHGYPNIAEEECPEEKMNNLKFYLNEITSSPDEVSIEAFHREWKTDYKRLERVHSYIQWLFPLREPGVNYMASELTKSEIQAFRKSEEAKQRLVESYELMLGFYGLQLLNKDTGEVKRADNWRERFANLERNMHNNLRITRILKSLGELGFEHYQAPLVRFFLDETLVRKNLSTVKRSVLDYFLFAVRDKKERRALIKYAFQHYEPKDKFVWCPRKIQKRLKKKSERKQEAACHRDGSAEDGQTKNGIKDGVAGGAPKEDKACSTVTEDTDTCSPQEGPSEDPKPAEEGSSVDPLPLGNGGQVKPLSSPKSVLAKSEEGMESDQRKGSVLDTTGEDQAEPEPVAGVTSLEKLTENKREGATPEPINGSAEVPPDVQDEGSAVASPDHAEPSQTDGPPRTEGGRSESLDPGGTSLGSEVGQAEKRPDGADTVDLSGKANDGEKMETAEVGHKDASRGPDMSNTDASCQEMPGDKLINGTNGKNDSEPMDVDE